MTPEQRSRQVKAVICQYRKMIVEGLIAPHDVDLNKSRYLWASEVICRLISTFDALGDFELNALRDVLNGKPPKIHNRLRDVLTKTKANPDAWVTWMMHNAPKYSRYRVPEKQYTVESIPLVEAYRLLMQEEPRNGEYRKRDWKKIEQRPIRVQSEQRTMWGM